MKRKKTISQYIFWSLVVFWGFWDSAVADIVGGEIVQEKDKIENSTVGLYTPSSNGHGGSLCTASLLGKDVALTAAHCIESGGPNPVVLFGRNLRSSATVKRSVTAIRVNSLWEKSQGRGQDEGDIALVRFEGGLPPGYSGVKPLGSEVGLNKGEMVELAGYGISDAKMKSGAGVLRKTKVEIVTPRPGKTEMILDQSHGRGACHGDSGGPAFVRKNGKLVVAGVTNRSYPPWAPDDCAHQVVYTKVSSYGKWIKQGERDLRSQAARRSVLSRSSLGRKFINGGKIAAESRLKTLKYLRQHSNLRHWKFRHSSSRAVAKSLGLMRHAH